MQWPNMDSGEGWCYNGCMDDVLRRDGVDSDVFFEGYASRVSELPWEIAAPQQIFVELNAQGLIQSPVLDSGCGTGDLAHYLATHDHAVLGIDIVPEAIALAKKKYQGEKNSLSPIAPAFQVHDVLSLASLGKQFKTICDSGVLHAFSDDDQKRYLKGVSSVLTPGGRFHAISFRDAGESYSGGPRRLKESDIQDLFETSALDISTLAHCTFKTQTNTHPAWQISAQL